MCKMDMAQIIKKILGPADSIVRLGIERGHRHPILFSHAGKPAADRKPAAAGGGQYKAPPDAFYLEVVRESATGGLGIELAPDSAGDTIAEAPGRVRDLHNIVHNGGGQSPKVIKHVKPEVRESLVARARARAHNKGQHTQQH